jgi:hypothetical protein
LRAINPYFSRVRKKRENMRVLAGLRKPGKALWRKITGEFDLENEPDRLELLFQACKTADQIAELDEAAAEAPLTVRGSMGQPVISPFIAEARVQRGLLAQLLARMNFAESGEAE